MKYNVITGGEIMLIGDLHISDVYTGKHKDFLTECMTILRQLTDTIEERKPSAVILLGDLVGWTETNIRNREVLAMVCSVLQNWNKVCRVYSLRGNHDIKGYPDFQFFVGLGLIIPSSTCGGYIDYYGFEGQELPEVRFHMVDYHEESRHLDILEGTSNIVLGHNNFTINGVTTWYSAHDGIELGMQNNLCGVDMVISGHIHNPSPEMYYATMPDGQSCGLFYLGNPTRVVKDKVPYEYCWLMYISYNETEHQTDVDWQMFQLPPVEDCFHLDETFVEEKSADELADEMRRQELKGVLNDLLTYRLNQGDPIKQVENIPNASDAAKKVAIDYLTMAFNTGG